MKKLKTSLLSLAMSALALTGIQAVDIVEGVYQITNASDFVEFANDASNGKPGANAVLTADIDLEGVTWTPIGTEMDPYCGTFDGQGHRISNLVINSTEDYQAIFGHIGDGATFKNLYIDKSCSFTGGAFMGALAAASHNDGTATFTNIGNEANVTGTGANAAAIIGVSMGGSCAFIITNCYNTGDITGGKESAAICGWVGGGSKITNFYNTGKIEGVDGSNKLYRNSATATNLFDIEGVQGDSISAEMVANGALAFALNSYKSEGETVQWWQNIDNGETPDASPVFDSTHGIVYAIGTLHCDGTPSDDVSGYSNTNQMTQDDHDYIDGVCSYCKIVMPDYVAKNDSVYEISDAKQLHWFANYVNGLKNVRVYGRLMADVDFSEYSGQGEVIGLGGHDFQGWFDGQGHTVTINYDTDQPYTSLFKFVKNGAVRNLITEGTVHTTNNGVAGIVGYMVDSTTVENCISKVTISCEVEGDVGLGGVVVTGTAGSVVRNCAFLGSIESPAGYGNGGIMCWANDKTNVRLESCYVNAQLNMSDAGDNNIIARNGATVTNCYYVDANVMKENAGATQIDEALIQNGELCYMLNYLKSDENVVWHQNIDNDAEADLAPLPFGNSGTVYAVGTLNCDGTLAGEGGFSNDPNGSVKTPHDFVDGICSFCHILDQNYMTPVDGVYEISTPEQLNWFALYNNSGYNTINGKLLADIDFTKYSADSVMIGTDNNDRYETFYGGTFDGQGHTVTVAYNRNDTLGGAALFGICRNATIKNLVTEGTVRAGYMIGGILIKSQGNSVIENCYSSATLTSFREGDATIGGIAAAAENHGVYRNCGFTGSIIAEGGTGNGGLMGYANGGVEVVFENCYVAGTFATAGNSAMICRNNPTMKNCYYVDNGVLDIDTRAIEITEDDLTSGALCFMLNNYKNGGTPWTQTLGTDNSPKPVAGGDAVYAIGSLACDGTATSTLTYSNTEGELTQAEHAYGADGVCANCGGRQISTPAQLLALSEDIGSGFANSNINVVLANDIDMSEITEYRGIGTEAFPFTGKFDGQGHVISNLVINAPDESYQGLFGVINNGAEIRNVTIDSTCSITANAYAAGIAACSNGTGIVIIENCGNEADITVTGKGVNAAGILGVNMGNTVIVRITNCYNTGDITGKKENAAISGWLGSAAEVHNCYNTGTIRGIDGDKTFARFATAPTYSRCYETSGKQVTVVTNEEVANGKLCWMLNNEVSGGENFFQTLGTDTHPVLFTTHQKVFEVNGSFTNDVVGIKDATAKPAKGAERIYSVDGMRLQNLQKGINIIRKADGTTQKVFVK